MTTFGEMLKEFRLAAGLSLREFCDLNGFDAGNYSKLERGKFPPPDHSKVESYARAMGLPEGGEQWISLFDAASAERGRIPFDIMEDSSLVEKLPVFFRTIRSEKKAGSIDLDSLAETIRKS
jgi:transcriptional regulator with XRE-family HTH domain